MKNSPQRHVLIKEIRERGVAWTSNGHARRGEELLLWAVSDAGNYEYIIQYGFHDDGTITFRMGSTGYNDPAIPYESHMHNALWYIDINLGHCNLKPFQCFFNHNTVGLMRHLEPDPNPRTNPGSSPLLAKDVMEQINSGFEGSADWNAEEFTGLNIIDTQTINARGRNISYDLMPLRTGTARHDELFSKHDFWVTQHNNSGLFQYEDSGLPYYLNGASIEDTDVVIWYMSSAHHQPRDEDHKFDATSGKQLTGIAQVMWSGFDLRPRNLFDESPLYSCAKVPQGIVGWWPFEEQPGEKQVNDIKNTVDPANIYAPNNGIPQPGALAGINLKSGNPGGTGPTSVMAAASGVTGPQGGALSFDGSTNYVVINDVPSLNFGTGDFSVDTWINTLQNSGTAAVILDKRTSSRTSSGTKFQGYSLYLYNGKLGVQLADGITGITYANYISNAFVADGYSHHIAVTVNRTGSTKEIQWYVDGNNVDTTSAPLLAGSLNNGSPLRLGVRSFELSGYFQGVLGELELFNTVLTPTEIHDIYAVGKCR